MLTRDGCRRRQQNLWQQLPDRYDRVLIGDPRHVQSLCNFRVNPLSFSADQRPLLWLQRDGQSVLLADNFLRRACSAEVFVDREIVISWYTHRRSVTNRDHALVQALRELDAVETSGSAPHDRAGCRLLLETEGVSHLAASVITEDSDPVFEDRDGRPRTVGDVLRQLRRCKDPDEIAILRHCMRAGDAGQAAAFAAVTAGATDFEVYQAVQTAATRAAGVPCLVYGDFRATNADRPKAGGLPQGDRLQNGDLFILDYSVVIHGYRSDFTNTIAVGDPTEAQVRQFEACRDALAAAEQELRAGTPCRTVYQAASDVLQQRGYGELAHHAGHGLGLEHPEPPVFGPESTDQLLAGDVVTLEPGCYIAGTGGMRFEHNYRVSETGAERLSGHELGLRPTSTATQ